MSLTTQLYPAEIHCGSWDAGHIQGIAVDEANGYVYSSFTRMLVKSDFQGNILGTVEGFVGHLGDLDFNLDDGRVYGSLEYKAEQAFYAAIFDVEQITRVGMNAEDSGVVTAVYLKEVVADYTADMDGDGVFDGDTASTADHRYGCSGIDGISFGPEFGNEHGPQQLMVAYGIYGNPSRTDNNYQVILQYNVSEWSRYEGPLNQADPHRSGPEEVNAKYFVYTGNTRYGVQNLSYDKVHKLWFLGVYRGSKPEFPNHNLYVVDGTVQPALQLLEGQRGEEKGLVLPLLQEGVFSEETGLYGWEFKADVGFDPLSDGSFYVARNFYDYSSGRRQESARLELYRWHGVPPMGFSRV
ncbi:hypothetical protein GC088_04775 [Arthrobacter sp. JZ12]|uniref:hypothetical protein n=1 Tax=Arthrobacter sp. JZ12 TaxID=2654190 RepID=UPI002B4A92FF|nr:hypothetical protein [Arthrobacter sp. JZ12]WRH24464.1 hypothetical protein GC088_04775 [Arthrobacter sp. JZ12]